MSAESLVAFLFSLFLFGNLHASVDVMRATCLPRRLFLSEYVDVDVDVDVCVNRMKVQGLTTSYPVR